MIVLRSWVQFNFSLLQDVFNPFLSLAFASEVNVFGEILISSFPLPAEDHHGFGGHAGASLPCPRCNVSIGCSPCLKSVKLELRRQQPTEARTR